MHIVVPQAWLLPKRYENVVDGQLRYTYCDPQACKDCPLKFKCTTKECGRNIIRGEHEATVELIRKRMELLPEIYKRRGATIEKVFGTIKWAMGAESLLLKGVEICRGEWSLRCTCYNLKRVIKLLGVAALLEMLQAGIFRRYIHVFRDISLPHLYKASSCP
jgi:hypothetical protein